MRVTQFNAYRGGRFVQVEVNFLKVPTAGVAKNVRRSRNCNQNKRKKELLKPFYVTVREILLSS